MKPNLFAFATNELSQDAFLAWLLQWADPSCAEHDLALHDAAQDFVRRLLGLQGNSPERIAKVEVERQWERIDVCADINGEHLLIIEDKTGSGQHSNQLARYRNVAQEWCDKEGRRLTCVYIKTQSDSAVRIAEVLAENFAVYSRSEFLEFLDGHDVKNDIYLDFLDRLREIENRESQFAEKLIGEWKIDDWKGFYRALEKRRKIENWFFVNNAAGGFLGVVLNYPYCQGYPLYMQIEQGLLCFKVGDVDYEDGRSEVRRKYHEILMSHRDEAPGLERPGRFGSGYYMTVASIPADVWLGAPDSRIDFAAVVERLNAYEMWLMGVIQQVEADAAKMGETHAETPLVIP